ncbi:MAG: HAD family phosphatase [Rhodobacteraceae bacterium]|jgi:HAD superfamily hydrolase (TIGR01509 family)|nr:HAD family phosphatase [Paracoccaceae bacterium]
MNPPAAVLFDCDGVVTDTEAPTLDILLDDLVSRGVPLTMDGLQTGYQGLPIEAIQTRIEAAGWSLPADWTAQIHAQLNARFSADTPLIPGILQVLDRLDAAGIPYAAGSNGTMKKLRITLGQHGLLTRFRAVLSGPDMGHPKPAPDLYLAAARACGAEPARCVVIEDSPTGGRSAIAGGIPCLGFAPHGRDTVPAREFTALGVPLFERMADLPRLLGL